MKYRIIVADYSGYVVEKRFLFFWRKIEGIYRSIDEAEREIKRHCGYLKKKNMDNKIVGEVVKVIDVSKEDQLIWKLKDE